MDRNDFDSMPVISSYSADDAVTDGTLVELAPPPTRILPIGEIKSLDGYLQNYGAILGKKAITALDPLHLPSRDPLPDFDDLLREPFEAQKHVIAASMKMMDTIGSGFVCGEMGCIAGESEVYDPVAGRYRRVDQITEPFHVVSHHDGKAVVGKAHVPFIKGTRDLYRVTLSDSRTFVSTNHHRLLTDQGWQLVSEVAARLREFGPVPLPSIAEPFPSMSPRGVEHSSRTPSGSLVGYPKCHHSCDEQPLLEAAVDQGSVQRQGDAREHSHSGSPLDDQGDGQGRNQTCQSSDHYSTTRSAIQSGCTNHADASLLWLSSGPYVRDVSLGQGDPQSPEESSLRDTSESCRRSASQFVFPSESSLGEFISENVHVTNVVFTRNDVYYDFTVDKFHNYVMEGVVHHNSGKSLIGLTAIHMKASLSRNQGGKGGKYRAVVLCPDHLISKWVREIEETIPDAIVSRFGPQGGEITTKGKRGKKDEKVEAGSKRSLRDVLGLLTKRRGNRWEKPKGAEWYIIGRNQAKWMSDWTGIGDLHRGFNGQIPTNSPSSRNIIVDQTPVLNEYGRPTYNKRGEPLMNNITARVFSCPKCGTVVRDPKGVPMGEKNLSSESKTGKQHRCKGTYMEMIPVADRPKDHGRDKLCPPPSDFRERKPGVEFTWKNRRWIIRDCGEPLYNYTSRPYRWSLAKIVQKKLKRLFSYLIIDEVHEQKSDESAQSMACGKLLASVDHVLALTGTIIGGYANHLFPLMMRITPQSLKEEGFEWGKDMAFSETYGRIDQIITMKEQGDSGPCVGGNVKSMRRASSGSRTERKTVRPGVMPTMFGKHMIGSSMFIKLEDVSENLPDLFEYIGGPVMDSGDGERDQAASDGWFDTAVDMNPDQKQEYDRVAATLELANRELLQRGSMKLLGAYLWTTMDYPDRPFGWEHDPEYIKSFEKECAEQGGETPAKLGHTVGYWAEPGIRTIDNFVGVVTPQSLPQDVIYPKEQRLIDICKKQKADGTQTWVYVQMTGKRNIQDRLKSLLEKEGLKVGILRATDVSPIEREEWIAKCGRDFDVMISHPQLVSTGLDLFSKAQGGHNYATIVFYETGYNLFTMRQAARRAWRIGQPRDCRVYYMYYKDTMQHKAMSLMSKKMAAAQALEGEFSEEGLAAMAGEDNLQMALAKNLSERINGADMQRSWSKIKVMPKKPKPVIKPSPLDILPLNLQMIAESIIESQSKPIPADVATEWPKLKAELAAVDAGFKVAAKEFEPTQEEEKVEAFKIYEEEDEEDSEIPELTEDILAKMFETMMANGAWNEAG